MLIHKLDYFNITPFMINLLQRFALKQQSLDFFDFKRRNPKLLGLKFLTFKTSSSSSILLFHTFFYLFCFLRIFFE